MSDVVYVIECTGDRYYVGTTTDLEHRLEQHFEGYGSEYTKEHPPERVIMVTEGGQETEKWLTLELMERYGWENVRGYAWSRVEMDRPPTDLRCIALGF